MKSGRMRFLGLAMINAILVVTAAAAFASTDTARQNLRVQLQSPQFLRPGDRMELPVLLYNNGEKELTGRLQLELFDAASATSVDGWLQNIFPVQYFTAAAHDSAVHYFPVAVPHQYLHNLKIKSSVSFENKTVGSEIILPVVVNTINEPKPATYTAKNLRLERRIYLLKKEALKHSRKLLPDAATIKLGDTIQVELTVSTLKTLYAVQITDALFAAVKKIPIHASAGINNQKFSTPTPPATTQWQLLKMPKGKRVFTCTYVALHKGTFTAPAATVTGRYDAQARAVTQSFVLSVED